jgi:hypothetical protein
MHIHYWRVKTPQCIHHRKVDTIGLQKKLPGAKYTGMKTPRYVHHSRLPELFTQGSHFGYWRIQHYWVIT